MNARNVIISLVLVLALLVFIIFKFSLEPKRKSTFRRNPSRIEYSGFALCRMECYEINANTVTVIIQKGQVHLLKRSNPCSTYRVNLMTKKNRNYFVTIEQCGTVAKVLDCYDAVRTVGCNCINHEAKPLSFSKINY
jgi:hypothetical protein